MSHEVGPIWGYKGYLILIIAPDSFYMNQYDDVANRLSESVSQDCTDDSSAHRVWERPNIQVMIFHEPLHNGVDLGAIVQESHAPLPIDSHPGYILDPVPLVKGVRIQEGSLHLASFTLGVSSWGTFGMVTFPWAAWAPFFGAIPSFWFKGKSVLDPNISGQLQIKWSGLLQWWQCFSSCWMSFTALIRHTMNSSVTPLMPSGSLLSAHSSLSALSSSRCATCVEGSWLTGCLWASAKERSSLPGAYLHLPWAGCGMVPLLPLQPPTLLGDNLNMSSHYCLPWGMPP